MGYGRRNTTLILIMTLVSVLGLTIAFAAFSSTLTISSNATVTPDSGEFKVVFSSKSDSLSTTGVTVTKTGSATAGTPTIDNSTNPTISGISASFTAPGEKIEYTFYARNEGNYDAYLSSIVFNNISGKSTFKECVASNGTDASLVASACNGIKVTTTVLSTSYTDTTLNITGHTLKKGNSELVKVTIEYTSGSSVADGPFRIDFGNIYLTYGSASLSGTPTLPEETDKICKAVTEATTGNVPMNQFAYGDEYVCDVGDGENKTFFVLENNTDTVSLIMGSNLGIDGKAEDELQTNNRVAWISKEDYIAAGGTESEWDASSGSPEWIYINRTSKGPITVNKKLKEYTTAWTSLSESQISLPTYDQIYKAAGNKTNGIPSWLLVNLSIDPIDAAKGYWTSTPEQDRSKDYASTVLYLGIAMSSVDDSKNYTIRPVITISKSLIK